jgi:type I restriction enzyme R subunit
MPKINEAERKTQERVLALFQDKTTLDYAYYGDLRLQINTNIIVDKLTAWLIS